MPGVLRWWSWAKFVRSVSGYPFMFGPWSVSKYIETINGVSLGCAHQSLYSIWPFIACQKIQEISLRIYQTYAFNLCTFFKLSMTSPWNRICACVPAHFFCACVCVCSMRFKFISAIQDNTEILQSPIRTLDIFIQDSSYFIVISKYDASLNHNGICRIPYKNASRMGLHNLGIVQLNMHHHHHCQLTLEQKLWLCWLVGRKWGVYLLFEAGLLS